MKAKPPRVNSAVAGLALAALITLLVAAAARVGLLEGVELEGYDFLVSRESLPAPLELVYVDFDDAAMQEWGISRIPRDKLAALIQKASSGGAEIIGLDVLLDERRGPEEDAALVRAMGDAGNVILANVFADEHLPGVEPLPMFREPALSTGFVNLPVDSDGFLRRMFLWMRTPQQTAESFPVAVAANFLQKPLQRGRGEDLRLGAAEIHVWPAAPNTALIGAWSREPVRTIPVLQFLSGSFDPAVKGKIVLVGQSSAKGKDRFPTPQFRFQKTDTSRQMLAGTEIQAAAVASLLQGKTVEVLGRARHWALNYLLAVLVGLIVVRWRFAAGLAAAAAGGLAISYFIAQVLFVRGVWMPFVSTEAGIVLVLPAGFGYRFLQERRLKAEMEAERRQLMGLFERYVSPDVASEIWERRDEVMLGGRECIATILFSDIRSFTKLTAGKPSTEVLAWLNDYLTAMDDIIRANGGYLNKYMGDGIMVVFGAPLPAEPAVSARRAIECALQMLERVEELNRMHVNNSTYPQLKIGVGVHTGTATAGTVGSRNRLEYSVIGETTNLASRLESLTKEFKVPIVMSPETHDLVKEHFTTRQVGETLVRGFTEEIPLFTATRSGTAGVQP